MGLASIYGLVTTSTAFVSRKTFGGISVTRILHRTGAIKPDLSTAAGLCAFFQTKAPERRVPQAGPRGVQEAATPGQHREAGLQVTAAQDQLRTAEPGLAAGSCPRPQDTNPRAAFPEPSPQRGCLCYQCVYSCRRSRSAISWLVPQTGPSPREKGREGRGGPTFPSDASPTLCCSWNLIQPLTKYT